MSRVLVIGGYGGFGGHLSRKLARSGHEVIVAGRTLERARQFCSETPGCRSLRIDRGEGIAEALASERPDVVIDASGPFQSADYAVVEDCIAARVSYIDLADAREFVTGIRRYDQAARAAGIVVISGASSVPALSSAVTRALAAGMEQVASVEMAISASSQASAGPAVATAIIGGVGQPIKLWRGGRWTTGAGWQEPRSVDIGVGDQRLGVRTVAVADVPDLSLLPQRLPGCSSVMFRAGTESRLAVVALWLASWPVRWGWAKSLAPLRGLLTRAHRLSGMFGSNRSGMVVRVSGLVEGRRLERLWSLIAEAGDGPKIPTLAAIILVQRIAEGRLSPGARDAGALLSLDEFEPHFAELSVAHAITESEAPPALYRRVMGPRFDGLAPAVQEMHDVLRDSGAQGQARVEQGCTPLARLVARIMRFPPDGDHSVHVHFAEEAGVETWTRDFAGHRFTSRLSQSADQLVEQFGPLRFHFTLDAIGGQLAMEITRWSLLGMPLPRALAPRSPAREWEEDGRFHFDVPVDLPFVGRIIRYRGWLAKLKGDKGSEG